MRQHFQWEQNTMVIRDLLPILNAKVLCGEENIDWEFGSACGSDLMSDVLAFIKSKAVLITGLTNIHVIRTAEMADICCVVFCRGKAPTDDILEEAREDGLVVLSTQYTCFTACGLLYEAGIRGSEELMDGNTRKEE